jgi:hypothetical protein
MNCIFINNIFDNVKFFFNTGRKIMTNCPKCGKKVPEKGYTISSKSTETGKNTDVTFGLCEDCALIVILKLQKK